MVVANPDEKSQVSGGGPLPDYEFHELHQLDNKTEDILPEGPFTVVKEAENLEGNDVASDPRELQRPLLDNKTEDTLPEDSSAVVKEVENLEGNDVAPDPRELQRPLLDNKTEDILTEDSFTVEVEAENLEGNDVAPDPRELQRPLLDNKTEDILPEDSFTVEVEAENPQDNVATVPSRQGCNERENHEARSRPGVSFKDKCVMFKDKCIVFLVALFLGVLILVVALVLGVVCGKTTLYNKDQPPLQNVTTPMQNLTTPVQNVTTPMQNLTTPVQNLTRLNCSTSSLDKVIWLIGRTTIAKYGNLSQTSAEICGLNMTDSRNLIIAWPHKCPGIYTCEIEGHPKAIRYSVTEFSAELISDT